jgi:hypothetical protein
MLAKGAFPTSVHHQRTTRNHSTCGMSDPCIISLKSERNNFKGLNFHNLMHRQQPKHHETLFSKHHHVDLNKT